jgi:6-phosphogluconolactonase
LKQKPKNNPCNLYLTGTIKITAMRPLLALACFFAITTCTAQEYYLFVGTYTTGKSKGIYVYKFNANNGELQWLSNTDSSSNPSFLAVSPNGKYLYAVNETGGEQPGRVSAFAFDKNNATLRLLNQQPAASTPVLWQQTKRVNG